MFSLTVVTPEKRILAGQEVDEVFVPGFRGELNVLPGHSPLLTSLRPGILKYRLKGEGKLNLVSVSGGYCQVIPSGVNVMADAAELPAEIDVNRSETSLKEAEGEMLSTIMNEDSLKKSQEKAARARARLELAKLRGATP